ncbi:PP2C family serine/threonine-protein phosphatase [Actinomadura hibisca]|uniref:PP2C family serine/threonine-protein phosphatase n=1 Tax=Actinomadura hibisca TaxID=68565 RepID=UPI000834FB25|nr:protein phosphatase 2C domain-containing protein [Actinomadura hibisca]
MTEDQSVKPAELACPACGEPVYPGEGFCEACGRRLGDGVAAPAPEPVRACAGCAAPAIDADGYCERCGLRQPAERDHYEIELPGPNGRLLAAGGSDRGKRYSRNEDALALAAHPTGVAAVVCDGVGSSPTPHEASAKAAATGADELTGRLGKGEDFEAATRAALIKAADAVAALAPDPDSAPSCTYVSAVTGPRSVTVGWVGDSRVYWLPTRPAGDGPRAGAEVDTAELAIGDTGASEDTADSAALGPARRLTDDDSWAAIMVERAALTEAEAEAHPNAHVITGWLGADAGEVAPHVRTFTVDGPGAVLVCSDGLWNYLPQAEALVQALADASLDPAGDPLGAVRTLVRRALDAGGRDNITVAVIPVAHPHTEQPR